MFDQQHGIGAFQAFEQIGQPCRFLVPHARHGFIQQDHPWFERQSHGDFQRALFAMRQLSGNQAGPRTKPDGLQQGLCGAIEAVVGINRRPEPQRLVRPRLHRKSDIAEGGQRGNDRGNLEGACQAQARALRHAGRGNVAPVKQDVSCIGPEQSGNLMDQRGFSRPVGTDQRMDFTGVDRQAHPVGDIERTEGFF